ncbi:SRPBCC family protein [Deinococcus pimensis]|uniref:SRPBCC family protein n=1 Tax=Deinococcus pimensis TaxID=309888 RepID=UPI0004B7B965|nr:SRPBCC family protein [Deinococcus pimensis]
MTNDEQQTNTQFTDSNQNASPTERLVFGSLGLGLIALGVTNRRNPAGIAAGVLGSVFVTGAVAGKSLFDSASKIRRTNEGGGIHIQRAVTIGVDADQLYTFWRRYENLPQFMSHLKSVTQTDERTSRWVANAPAGTEVSWEAETIEDVPGRRIAWRSKEGSTVPNEGNVEFRVAPGGRGTEVHVELQYHPPGGTLGAAVARFFGEEPNQQIKDDLTRLKRLMELGQVPTTEGQPSGRRSGGAKEQASRLAADAWDTGRKQVSNDGGTLEGGQS